MLVLYETRDGYAVLTLNRPEKYNALSLALLRELAEACHRAESDDGVRALVVTGAGRAFCAGADVGEMQSVASVGDAQRWIAERAALFECLGACTKPVVAAINGMALGGGLEIAMQADVRIAARSARLGQPEVKLGLIPGAGGTQRLARLIGLGRALEWLMTGESMDAEEAFRVGLVNRVVPDGEALPEAEKLAARLAQQPPLALRLIKEVTRRGLEGPLEAGLLWERQAFVAAMASEDAREGIRAFVEKRPPAPFKGR